ncbi:MAG: LysM peptidoglycan-binding domain-containing protein [Lachnospiraceae bacterium]|nr:LysM peptidoglycan-binding domain-containing protein [Lachnospiraceae bacterium]
MIEVIYDKSKEAEENVTEENAVSIGLKLPKNIRQIGSPSGNKRIYIEDYVVTYLNYIARPGSTCARGAILLGETKKSDIGDVIFISGAVDAQNIEFDMDETEFTEEAWSEIYEQVKEYFPDLTVVGWFLSRMGFSTAINDKIEKVHVDNFPGNDKVLLVTDSLENDEAFYMYQKGQLVRQKGYYIYYSKNEAMQAYIIHQRGDMTDTENNEIRRKDEEIIKAYRDKNGKASAQKSEGVNLLYVASSFVVLAMLAMGITVISNYDKVKDMEVTINRLELTAEATEEVAAVMNNPKTTTDDVTQDEMANTETTVTDSIVGTASDVMSSSEMTTEMVSEPTTEVSVVEEIEEPATENVSTEQAISTISQDKSYYIVQEGDSLGTIALYYYGDVQYAENIAVANNMSINDKIYLDQILIIPEIN